MEDRVADHENSSANIQDRHRRQVAEYVAGFNEVAKTYDRDFSSRSEIRVLRSVVWAEIVKRLSPPSRILDLGCGTGEDLSFLARQGFRTTGIDMSSRMLEVASSKLKEYEHTVKLRLLNHLALGETDFEEEFDGILSNFGALNTISELRSIKRLADRRLRRGGYLFLCLINRFYLRELLRGEFRRLRGNPVTTLCGSQQVKVFYHGLGALSWFGYRKVSIKALSVFLRSDVHSYWPLNRFGDHLFTILRKQ